MPTIEVPNCPVCQKPMLQNIAGKQRNPKAPDWKCSDQNCKFQFNKQTGQWVISEYITSMWDNTQNQTQNAPQANPAPYRANQQAMGQRKEFQNTMDYKAQQIQKAQASKEDSMRLFSSGRDAVLITTALMKEGGWTDEIIKAEIEKWNKYLYNEIYCEKPFV